MAHFEKRSNSRAVWIAKLYHTEHWYAAPWTVSSRPGEDNFFLNSSTTSTTLKTFFKWADPASFWCIYVLFKHNIAEQV